MIRLDWLRPRMVILFLLWTLPALLYVGLGLVALYQTGWLSVIAWTLPLLWVTAWLVGRFWKPSKLARSGGGKPLKAPDFWTPHDALAIQVVEDFRHQVEDVDRVSIADANRYIGDAQALAQRLAKHYHAEASESLLHPLTLVEVFAVIHLAVEDMEDWIIANVPGSGLARIGYFQHVPGIAKAVDVGQTFAFLVTTITNPGKLLAYPLWRKAGHLTIELQNELVRAFYQRYLRQVGFYLIEMYSGRLKAGSRQYREQFGHMAAAAHASRGDLSTLAQLEDVSTTIAVMGQVKAGKSSLINALMQQQVTATSILPETREVHRFQYPLPGSSNSITLLDTPGYSEADVTKHQLHEIETAAEEADIVLLVLAANTPSRDSDVKMVRSLLQHYRQRPHLKPPAIVGVLTHIDLLRPVREWAPPYNWRQPQQAKEQSIAKAVQYAQELFGDAIASYACVYTGDTHPADGSVADELVPQLTEHLSRGHSAAILKAFYKQLGQQRLQALTKQLGGLLKTVGRNAFP